MRLSPFLYSRTPMKMLIHLWSRLEEVLITLSLALMTLVTFFYVLFNNLYTPFLSLYDRFEWGWAEMIGVFILTLAQEMTWSIALTKVFFGTLIFLGAAYGVRTAGHIGIDVLVKKLQVRTQRHVSLVAVLCCIVYALLIIYASYGWILPLFTAGIEAEDLEIFGLHLWQIALVIPVAYTLVLIRFVELGIAIMRGRQHTLGLADEAGEALKLQEEHPE